MIYRFANCELDPGRFELRLGGTPQKIEPQVFELLCFLVQRPDQFVGKEELHDAIWQGRVVSDSTIASAIKAARRAIGDDGTTQRLIRTVHGRGFSFVGPVIAAAHGRAHEQRPPGTITPAAHPSAAMLSTDVHLGELLNGDAALTNAETHLLARRAMLQRTLESAGGRIVAMTGGGIAATFDSAGDAVQCAAALQRWGLQATQAEQPNEPTRVLVRVGVSDLDDDPDKALGTAARLQCLASPGEICVTGSVEQAARGQHGFAARPVAGDLDRDLNDLCPSIIHAPQLRLEAERPGMAQLQCGTPIQPREPSLVILPFQAIGNDELASELAEGLRIDIQNGLVKIASILLIAAGSANAFRTKTPEFAARSLGVRYVLHGVVQIVKARARVSLELIDTLSTHALWSEQFEVKVDDAFAIQDDITRKVVAALDVKLYSGEQARIWHQALTDPKIVRVFYRGVRLFFLMNQEAMAEARLSFEAVAAMRSESSIGATWVAMTHWIDHMRRWRDAPAESGRLAKHWADVAARLPDADGQAHTVLAHVRLLDREFDAALAAGRKALEIRPGCANANGFFGHVLHYCGEQDEAIRRIKRGIRLQPVFPAFFACILAASYFTNGQPEAALAVAKEALRLNPRDIPARLVLVAGCHATGAHRLARIFAAEILRLDPAFSVAAYREGQPYRESETMDRMAAAWLGAGLPPSILPG